jgi:hypothetical protein
MSLQKRSNASRASREGNRCAGCEARRLFLKAQIQALRGRLSFKLRLPLPRLQRSRHDSERSFSVAPGDSYGGTE